MLDSLAFPYQFTLYMSCVHALRPFPLFGVSDFPFTNWTFRGQGEMVSEIFSNTGISEVLTWHRL